MCLVKFSTQKSILILRRCERWFYRKLIKETTQARGYIRVSEGVGWDWPTGLKRLWWGKIWLLSLGKALPQMLALFIDFSTPILGTPFFLPQEVGWQKVSPCFFTFKPPFFWQGFMGRFPPSLAAIVCGPPKKKFSSRRVPSGERTYQTRGTGEPHQEGDSGKFLKRQHHILRHQKTTRVWAF